MKNVALVDVAEHAYSLIGGLPLDEDMDDCEKEYWASIPREDIVLASKWKLVSSGKLYDILVNAHKSDPERVNPYPGGPTLNTEELETFRLHGKDEGALVWRDVCITWYQYPGRCMCASRGMTEDELVQFEQELNRVIALQ